VLHVPVGRLVNGALAKGLHLPLESWVPYSGIVFLGFFVPACWLADRLYDAPMRSLLSRLSGLKPARPALGKTG
jgi:peptidoglycan/LPS O-acetylase OafA/YrhL